MVELDVYKFGGTSQGSKLGLENCVEILKRDSRKKAVVVSAPSGITNLLQQAIQQVHARQFPEETLRRIESRFKELYDDSYYEGLIKQEFTELLETTQQYFNFVKKSNDFGEKFSAEILSFGEKLESKLFTYLLNGHNVKASTLPIDAMILEGDYLNATYNRKSDINLRKYMHDSLFGNEILVVPGFIGKNAKGETLVFDRGGSDYTQTLVARALDADAAYNCTDVNGILPINPSSLQGERISNIIFLSYNQAQELSRQGAKVLHPRCIAPLKEKNIPLYVCNTFNFDGAKTLIHNEENPKELIAVTGKNNNYVNVKLRTGEMEGSSGYVFAFAEALKDVDVDTLSTSAVEIQASFSSNGYDLEKIRTNLSKVGEVSINNGSALIAIVGSNLNNSRYVGEFFKTLHEAGVSVNQITKSNDVSLWVSIPSEQYERAQLAVYNDLLR